MNGKLPFWIMSRDSNRFRSFAYSSSDWMSYLESMKENKKIANIWKPPKLFLFSDIEHVGREEKLPIADFMNGLVFISISEKAKSILVELMENQVELLPLDTEIGKYYELNIDRICCLDEQKCVLKRPSSGKGILHVEKYAFFINKIAGRNIFLSAELGFTKCFVSDVFRQTIEENSLSGLLFSAIPVPE